MDARVERALTVGRAIVHEVRTEKVTFLAGSIAYHAFLSLLPLFLLVLAVIGALGNPGLERNFIDVARAVLTDGASEVLLTELRSTSTSVSLFGGVLLIWGTLRIFRGLDTAFSDIYESEAENTFADQIGDGLIVLVTFALALIGAAAVQSAVDLAVGGLAGWLLQRAALVVSLSIVFFPLYYIFPDEEGITVPEVLPGVAFAAVGLTAFESLFRLYVETSGRDEGATVVAGILVLLTWLYFSGLVILLGAVVNAVLSNRSRDVNIRPVVGGVPREADAQVDRDRLVDGLDRLRDVLARADPGDGTPMTVSVGDDRVTFPRPDAFDVESGSRLLSRDVAVELRWSAAGDDGAGTDAGAAPTGAAGDGDGDGDDPVDAVAGDGGRS
jgi:membrane protein